MQFTSLIFITCLMPVFFVLAFLLREKPKCKLVLLFIYDVIFYIWGGYLAFFISVVICFLTWILNHIIAKHPQKHVLIICVGIALIPMVLAKNSQLFIVPLGISFYTFEAVSLLVDTYRDEHRSAKSLLLIFLYMIFFATVSQGPIVRFACFEEGLFRNSSIDLINKGVKRFAIGLGKKILIADKLAPLSDFYFVGISRGNTYSSIGLWIGVLSYASQIFFDFSGYSDMAIGIALALGFDIPENFNAPYWATSIKDFWRRWHISLSTWFRDYLYIPLGGNRVSIVRMVVNLLIVWIATGVWHGNDWTFIIWGIGYFLLLIFEKWGGKISDKLTKGLIGHFYTLFFVNILWVFFRAENINEAFSYLRGLFLNFDRPIEPISIRLLPFLIFSWALCLPLTKIKSFVAKNKIATFVMDMCLVAVVILSVCAITNTSYTPFIYGKF